MLDDLNDYKPYDALDVIEAARAVFLTLAGAALLALVGYAFTLMVFSL